MKITRMELLGNNWQIPTYDISHGFDCSHWGLTDLYDGCEEDLRELLNSGYDFFTEWCSCKKELMSARYSRQDGEVIVQVSQWADDLWEQEDLIYDALWARLHREDIEFSEEFIDSIREAAIDAGIDDCASEEENLGRDATYEDVMDAVERLVNATDATIKAWFEELQNIVEDHVRFMEESEGK